METKKISNTQEKLKRTALGGTQLLVTLQSSALPPELSGQLREVCYTKRKATPFYLCGIFHNFTITVCCSACKMSIPFMPRVCTSVICFHLNFLRDRIKKDTKLFYFRLLSPNISRGATDYYVMMLVFDVLCMITIVFGVSSFGVSILCLLFNVHYANNTYMPLNLCT